jgi:hypothetical protein
VRPNVRRLASLSGGRGEPARLNLSTAVVDAGAEAWFEIAPALEGDRASIARLGQLTREGVAANLRRRQAGRHPSGRPREGSRSLMGAALPPPRCQGTPEQRSYLDTLVRFVQETRGFHHLFPAELQLRISKRMSSGLGLHTHRNGVSRITVAERLFRPGLECILWDTVKHELAHVLDLATNPAGRTSHGPRWREWAARLGARPTRLCSREEAERVRRAPGGSVGARLEYPNEVKRWLALEAPGPPDRPRGISLDPAEVPLTPRKFPCLPGER